MTQCRNSLTYTPSEISIKTLQYFELLIIFMFYCTDLYVEHKRRTFDTVLLIALFCQLILNYTVLFTLPYFDIKVNFAKAVHLALTPPQNSFLFTVTYKLKN